MIMAEYNGWLYYEYNSYIVQEHIYNSNITL